MSDTHSSDFHDAPADSGKLVDIHGGDSAAELMSMKDKCEVDPIKAQDDALITVALKLRQGKVAVNDLTVDEARSTMIRSNYAPDWTKAHWEHPLLANLRNLSCLSSSDLPSHTKRGLVDERKAIDRVAAASSQQRDGRSGGGASDGSEALIDGTDTNAVVAAEPGAVVAVSSSSAAASEAINCEVADPESITRAVDHGVNAVFEVSPFVLRQKALLELSSETISNDPQLLALVSAVAQSHKTDPIVAGKVAMGETPTIPVTVLTPSISNVVETRRKVTDALPKAGAGAGCSRGFHASDIAAYDELRNELSPERQKQEEAKAGNKKSMHDVGYKTWCQKRLDQPSEYEDMERYAAYRDQVTTLEGKSQAMVELASRPGE